MKRSAWLLALLFTVGCAKVLAVRDIPQIVVGEPSFFRTIEAHTDAPIVSGNRIEVLLNGDETFPARVTLEIPSLGLKVPFEAEIKLK